MNLDLDLSFIMPPESSDPIPPQSPFVETMLKALESPRGVKMDGRDRKGVLRLRFRFYRERKREEAKGNRSFEPLVFTIDDDRWLIIQKIELPGELIEL